MAKISEIMLLQQPAQPALIIESQTDMNGLLEAIGGGFMKISSYLEEYGIAPADIPFVMYKDFESLTEQNIRLIVGFKLPIALPDKGEMKCVELPAKKVITCLHRGDYNTELPALYNEMSEWIKTKDYEAEGSSIEYYYSGPDIPLDEQVTRIEMPLK